VPAHLAGWWQRSHLITPHASIINIHAVTTSSSSTALACNITLLLLLLLLQCCKGWHHTHHSQHLDNIVQLEAVKVRVDLWQQQQQQRRRVCGTTLGM
jgi:hypothetical protein